MDSSDKRITFDSMPAILAQLRDYLPGHNARCTIYQWIRYDGFPYYQNAKSYYFRRSEVDDWLIRNGRKR